MIHELQEWLKRNFPIANPVTEITHISDLSARTFERRFKKATGLAPIAYVHQVRIDEAKRRLEKSSSPIDQISWEVGYEDAAAFRRLFKWVARVTPGKYRSKFAVR